MNLAEKARAGNWGALASFKLRDSKRMKLLIKVNFCPRSETYISNVLFAAVRADGSVRGELNRLCR